MRQGGRLILAQLRAVVAPRCAALPALCARSYATTAPPPPPPRAASDAEMQRRIFQSAMASDDSTTPSAATMASMENADGFREEHVTMPGTSKEDAFGHMDPLMAVEETMRQMGRVSPSEEPSLAQVKGDVAAEIDQVASAKNRRRNRRKRSLDTILGDVLHDTLLMRDMGEKPSADFVYKRAQERMYEEEYGKKPPSAKDSDARYIPFPPDFHMHRLLPLFAEDVSAAGGAAAQSGAAAGEGDDAAPQRPVLQSAVYTKNHMNAHSMIPPDPWPERSITPENPVWTQHDVEQDREQANGKGLAEWEERMYAPRPHYDLTGEFVDAMDELAYWEVYFLRFVRDVPISQRRSLPYLHEWYRLLVHRVVRAERRYICVRDALLKQSKVSTPVFARTEKVIENVRAYYAETHKSLASPNYDPLRMKKSLLAPVLRMTEEEFCEWQEAQRQQRNALAAEFS